MNLKKPVAGFLVILVTVIATAFVKLDDDPIQKIASALEKWSSDAPFEKVYLQFDKPYYGVGDNIWFKAYVTVGGKHQLSALSGALNVELIDERDSVKQWVKLPVTSGVAWGDFALSDTLQEGNYRIRAYTNWMRNAGEEYFFQKKIAIGNAATNTVFTQASYTYSKLNNGQKVDAVINFSNLDKAPFAGNEVNYNVRINDKQILKGKGTTDTKGNLSISFINATSAPVTSGKITTDIKVADKKTVTKTINLTTTSGLADVQFFPESGYMVNGIRSRVAFKAVDANGLGVEVKGKVIDNTNKEVAEVTTKHLGMGSFAFTPESGKTYKASLTYPDGSQNTVSLPASQNDGYVMLVNNTDAQNISIKIIGSSSMTGKSTYVVGQSGGVICYAAKNTNGSINFGAQVAKSKFPSGIAQFTLFDASGQPINERIVFIQHQTDILKVDVSANKTAFAPREKVKINIAAKTNDDKPALGAFSAAVIDESKVPVKDADESGILSQILLTSDLKGYIEQPNYYFTDVNATTAADLDILMLTQGYRRFEWKALLAGQFPPVRYQPEKTLQIAGTIKTSGGKPVPNDKITLFTTAGGTFIIDTVADAQGRFAFKNMVFKDSIKFVLQARTAKGGKNVDIVLDKMPLPTTVKNKSMPDVQVNSSAALLTYLKNSKAQYDEEAKYGIGNHTIMLKEVTVTEKKKNPALANSANLNGAGNADQVITSDLLDKLGCVTIDQCLQGRLLGVIFRGGIPYSTRSQNQPMQLIVDGIYVESDFLSTIPPMNVASVEVLRTIGNTAIYGGRGSGGVLIINTKRGGEYNYDASQIYSPGIMTYTPKGFYTARQFYAPKYDDPKTNTAIADLRTTIHWEPSLITSKDGNASFEYFNAGSKGTYRVVVEGINDDGYLGHTVFRYKVE
ncbi:TonB-dependent receptor plug domain-containing protein [uncultured Mucilaginibacter sp.]|uniref:TonB-dependent receptor plug domain-containing protein n=1 Tax=uncultured Mucilaginibacter sp. TaxID=797541 RepID=UPI0025CF4842|nr:TonB-dependent receptor plug domain-containing protein [uncultured Mucilaginibacter sp.]